MSLKSTCTREGTAQWHPGSGCRGERPWVSVLRSLNSEMPAHLWSSEPAAAWPSAVVPDVLGEHSEYLGGRRSQTRMLVPQEVRLSGWVCHVGALRLPPWELVLLSALPPAWAPWTHLVNPPRTEFLHGPPVFSQEKVLSDSLIKQFSLPLTAHCIPSLPS